MMNSNNALGEWNEILVESVGFMGGFGHFGLWIMSVRVSMHCIRNWSTADNLIELSFTGTSQI